MAFGAVSRASRPAIASFGNRFIGGNIPLSPGGSAAPRSFGTMPNINTQQGVRQGRQDIRSAVLGGGFATEGARFGAASRGAPLPQTPGRLNFGGSQPQSLGQTIEQRRGTILPPSQRPFSPDLQQQSLNAIRANAAQQASPGFQNKLDVRPGVSRDLSQPLTSQAIGRVAGINAQSMEDSAMQALRMRIANQQHQLQSNQLFAGNQLSDIGQQIQRQGLLANDDLSQRYALMQALGFM